MNLSEVKSEGHIILQDFDFHVDKSEVCAVLCSSAVDEDAVGKVFDPSCDVVLQGSVELFGTSYGDRGYLKENIYYVGYGSTLIDGLSMMDNIFLTDRSYYCHGPKNARNQLRSTMESFSISVDLDSAVESLSMSEKVMAEFLRAYICGAELCVIRDAFARLTKEHQKIAMELIHAMQDRYHTTFLYITTRLEDALIVAEHLVVVREQHIKGIFTSDEVRQNPKPLMYCVSGWSGFDSKSDSPFNDMVSLLLEMHNAIESTTELKKALELLANSITGILHADSCVIALLDDELRTSMVIGDEHAFSSRLLGYIKDRLRTCHNGVDDFKITDEEISAGELCHIFYAPVLLNNELAGMILTGFSSRQKDTLEICHIMESFSKEMAIAVETSRLVGKSVLLQESHHRIKNNLQVIVNLLFMQKINLMQQGYNVSDAFDHIINQVKSIAVIHDLLSKDKLGKSIVNLKTIIEEIVGFYRQTGIQFELQLDNISIPYNTASTISLIINELVANCVKHAFPNRDDCWIHIVCSSNQGDLRVSIHDNGIGFPPDDGSRRRGIGSNIIETSVLKMGGTITEKNCGGAWTDIVLPRDGIYE